MNKKFIELYDYAVLANRIPKQIEFNEAGIRVYEYLKEVDRNAYESKFISWLRDIKGSKIDDNSSYINAVNKSNFLEFLKYQDEIDKKNNSRFEAEIKSFKGDEIIKTFEHKLNDTQLNNLLILINQIKLFKVDIDIDMLKSILDCTFVNELSTHTTYFAHLLNRLSIKKLISIEWQSVVNESKLFKGSRGAYISNKNLSSTLQKINTNDETIKEITKVVSKL